MNIQENNDKFIITLNDCDKREIRAVLCQLEILYNLASKKGKIYDANDIEILMGNLTELHNQEKIEI